MEKNMSEYSALRDELVAKQERKASIWLHMYILFLSLFVLGFEVSPYMFLLTFVVIIPYQEVINNMEWNISRISAYIRIFYEDGQQTQKWETLNTEYKPYQDFLNRKFHIISRFIRAQGSIHLGLLSACFFIYNILLDENKKLTHPFTMSYLELLGIVAAIVLCIFTVILNQKKRKQCESELISIMKAYKQDVMDKKI